MGKMLLVTSQIVTYAYVVETFTAWFNGDRFERWIALHSRPFGPYALVYWVVIVCNCVVPQLLWWRRFRITPVLLFCISLLIQVGMWSERFMLIVSSLAQDYLTASWHDYRPSFVDVGILMGTLSFILFVFLVFLRFIPFIPISDLKELAFRQRLEVASRVKS